MKLLFSSTNALNKWLTADLPRFTPQAGKQAGVNSLTSDANCMSWQIHILDNHYRSYEKTIIACEANSRTLFFIPVAEHLSIEKLTEMLTFEWQLIMAETLESYALIPRSDIAFLLSELSDINFDVEWVKNTDLSINGHTSDAGHWVQQILREKGLTYMTKEQAVNLAIYLNTTPKRVTNKQVGRKKEFIPIEKLLNYCQQLVKGEGTPKLETNNVIDFMKYKG